MAIKCCRGCVAPKRHPKCHDSCPEYLAEKKLHEEQRAAHSAWLNGSSVLYAQRSDSVAKALKRRGR